MAFLRVSLICLYFGFSRIRINLPILVPFIVFKANIATFVPISA